MSTPGPTTPRSSRAPHLLTLDLGNTRAKLRGWRTEAERPELVLSADLRADERLPEALAGLLAELPRGLPCAVSSVAGATGEARSLAVLDALGHRVRRAPDPGLLVLCEPPEEVGRDRLYAARGALELVGGPVCVVDAGTALTVDLADLQEAPGGTELRPRRFLGGAIAAGPALLARALARGTARLPEVEPAPGDGALGRSTRAAIRAGCTVGFRGAARELVERVVAESGRGDAVVVLTGGAAPFLLEPGPFTDRPLRVEPELVHLGLLLAHRDLSVGAP